MVVVDVVAVAPVVELALAPLEVAVVSTGPPGPSLAGSSYTHTQASAASTWSIPHNLGYRPTVSVYTTGGVEVEAEVAHLSANVLEARFAAPMAGSARLT